MEKLTIWYSVQNGGDGSAYPKWFDSQKLAEWDQDNMDEGWGESCTGSITFESNSPITALFEVMTKEGWLAQMILSEDDNLKKYKKDFFKKGLPKFEVRMEGTHHYGVYHDDKLIHKHFAYPRQTEEGRKETEKFLNS